MDKKLNKDELFDFLEGKYIKFANPKFIQNDPIKIPHSFSKKEDIEISGFIAATIAWGQRKSIIKNSKHFIELMDDSPYEFIMGYAENDLKRFDNAVHRTFNGEDLKFFVKSLRNIYTKYGSPENLFASDNLFDGLAKFHQAFFEIPFLQRTKRHVANVNTGSAAKRLNMYLRWMVRNDNKGVDFGIWKNIKPAQLYIPLDLHTGRISRMLGLLERKQDDWKAVLELTQKLREFDKNDPVKYDFALFGVGVNEDF
ncbi:MAG: TIGR02757 family protein [Bacteroidales bacterium]|nr:TIGR02757 family protein [Bacteroidales bacterium]MDY0142122.1 TIGR02757 family protein [Bacteroidales bacterium]